MTSASASSSTSGLRARVRPDDKALVTALLVTLVLWNIPYGWIVLYPFKIFATWLHESSHALVMMITGAGVERIELFSDTSGMTFPMHGVSNAAQAAISCAGYMGTALAGATFLILGRTERGARWILAILGLLLMSAAALYVRNPFGAIAVAAEGIALVAIARWAGERYSAFLVNLLAAQSCINAVLDIRVLFGGAFYVDGQPHAQSDADLVAAVTHTPAAMWGILWLLWSFGLFYLALRFLAKRRHDMLPA